MGYRLEWRLVGREDRLLDSGQIDDGFFDDQTAFQALKSFLVQFPVWGRDVESGGWWAKKFRDADLKVVVSLHDEERIGSEMLPLILAAKDHEMMNKRQ